MAKLIELTWLGFTVLNIIGAIAVVSLLIWNVLQIKLHDAAKMINEAFETISLTILLVLAIIGVSFVTGVIISLTMKLVNAMLT
jgi:cell division protein FtsX